MLTSKQILKLLEKLEIQVITEEHGYIFAKRRGGYSEDAEIGGIQAALSIMLEVAAAREAG